MAVVGLFAVILLALSLVLGRVVIALSVPDLARYRRLRRV